ncbi:MAG: hypothetical protein EZS28_050562 [Streblomastix strix]|uniref:Uncharacterized protein n=1 Tax=Streblomastix strix TaxID=222440 RepID=A0A5J4T897_9EUKA|nr:MAG: hypothetical protein EZS28_050562 [Streblomastix strix]
MAWFDGENPPFKAKSCNWPCLLGVEVNIFKKFNQSERDKTSTNRSKQNTSPQRLSKRVQDETPNKSQQSRRGQSYSPQRSVKRKKSKIRTTEEKKTRRQKKDEDN